MARRNGIAYFIIQSADDSEPTMLGRLEVGNFPIQLGYLRIMVHTSGEGHETIVLLKQMTIHAETIQSSIK